ncbi:MAG: efflux RND transporter permease subunit [Gammaproteobacteria bacterium]|nr:efflux RND transporter permease subunit [Gammaproteobacteria bacterium]MBU1653486.1 efflux RND transporter permease subunit [Gammaproteobacteria bacterium]MBU1962727.1 efflux RND transporter permease subunit [Gammaproteobacteria bacterium]
MMRWIVGSSLKHRFIVVAAAALLTLFGVLQMRDSPMDVFPEFAPPRVEIQTICVGLSPEEVEELVTVPLEQALNGLPELKTLRSKSVPGLSSILLYFNRGIDEIKIRQLVQERLSSVLATLPTWAAPPYIMPPLSSTARMMKIGITSDKHSMIDLSMIAYWKIRARLLRVPGVANVAIWGERIRMPQVQVDPARMLTQGVSLNEVMETTADALDAGILKFSNGAIIGTGGWIETPNQRLGVRHIQPIQRAEDLANIPIDDKKKADGTPLVLGDVANLQEGTWPLMGDAVINDGPGLMLIVGKFPWGNTLEVTRGVEAALDELKAGLPDIEIDSTIFRPAGFIEMAIDNLTNAMVIGGILVILVLVAFLYEWRVALITCTAIPLSLIVALLAFSYMGVTINTMILAGLVIALGAVVDDAIIDIENIVRRLRQRRAAGDTTSAAKIMLGASMEVRSAIVYATLIEVAALIPVFFLEGLSGTFFFPLALAYTLAILGSMLVALTLTPALAYILLRNAPLEKRVSPLLTRLQDAYEGLLARIIKTPKPAYAIVGILMAAGVAVLPFLGQTLLPSFKERDFLMHWLTWPDASIGEETRITQLSSVELRAIPGVRNFGAHIGQAMLADEVYGVYFGENWVSVDPKVDYDQTRAAIEKVVEGYPGLYRDVQTYLQERMKEVLTGEGHAIVTRIYGPNLAGLRQQADEVKKLLDGVPGIKGLHVSLQKEIPQIRVKVDIEAAQRHGIKPGDVRRAAATLVNGEEVGDLFHGGRAYDVNVWSIPKLRSSPNDVANLPIDIPDGGQVRLGDIADVRIAPAQNTVMREDNSRYINVSADVAEGHALSTVADEIEDRMERFELPLGYYAKVLGSYAERQAADARLKSYSVAAAVAVFLLLLISFGSTRLATLSFLTLPSALVGGLLAAYFTGGIISLGSLVGFFTVFGIAARNGIMMINHYQHLEREEGETFGPGLVLRGARERLAPILMTALTTALALVPLVISGSIPGNEIEHPLAIIVLSGLVTSTLLNLFVVPSLYLRFGRGMEPVLQPQAETA